MINMPSYRLMVGAAKYMDKWFLDPILGFILPAGIGDALTSVFAFPLSITVFAWLSRFR